MELAELVGAKTKSTVAGKIAANAAAHPHALPYDPSTEFHTKSQCCTPTPSLTPSRTSFPTQASMVASAKRRWAAKNEEKWGKREKWGKLGRGRGPAIGVGCIIEKIGVIPQW